MGIRDHDFTEVNSNRTKEPDGSILHFPGTPTSSNPCCTHSSCLKFFRLHFLYLQRKIVAWKNATTFLRGDFPHPRERESHFLHLCLSPSRERSLRDAPRMDCWYCLLQRSSKVMGSGYFCAQVPQASWKHRVQHDGKSQRI